MSPAKRSPTTAELRRLLRLTLPDYMIPHPRDRRELPRNANGKVDRRSLVELPD